jgi:beta-carotene 15,15'-monooxygenase
MATKTAEKIAALFENYSEVIEPEEAIVEGKIPLWLNVSLLRNGPGMFNIGNYQYKHWFDGLAYMQRFGFSNGKMTYSARYLKSDTYKINMASNRICFNEFGTFGYSDPCKSILGKLSTFFTEDQITDNASVNFMALGDTVWAATETPKLLQIDPKTLETLNKVDISKIISLNTFTAHQQYDSEGNLYHIGCKFGKQSEYIFAVTKNPKNSKTPPAKENQFAETSIIGTLAATDDPCYNHSFAMTENYIILFETPLRISIWSLLTRNVRGLSFRECMYWKENVPVFIRILDKRTGKEMTAIKFRHEAFFSFHQANAYEKDGCIIMDYCQIKKAGDLEQFELENLRNNGLKKTEKDGIAFCCRLVIPLEVDLSKFKEGEDLIKKKKFARGCKAVLKEKNEIWLEQEILTDIGFEFPRYNMNYNLKPYKYIYGSTLLGSNDKFFGLIKINVETLETKTWSRNHDLQIAAEPVFVPDPNGLDEDDGVVLAPIVNFKEGDAPFVVVLDAKSFTEIARCKIGQRLPLGFHAQYYNN